MRAKDGVAQRALVSRARAVSVVGCAINRESGSLRGNRREQEGGGEPGLIPIMSLLHKQNNFAVPPNEPFARLDLREGDKEMEVPGRLDATERSMKREERKMIFRSRMGRDDFFSKVRTRTLLQEVAPESGHYLATALRQGKYFDNPDAGPAIHTLRERGVALKRQGRNDRGLGRVTRRETAILDIAGLIAS